MQRLAMLAAGGVVGSGIGMLIGGNAVGFGFIGIGLWMLAHNERR